MYLRKRWPELFSNGKMRIPEKVAGWSQSDWHSDLVISGGGTMNREARHPGRAVYSVFRGQDLAPSINFWQGRPARLASES